MGLFDGSSRAPAPAWECVWRRLHSLPESQFVIRSLPRTEQFFSRAMSFGRSWTAPRRASSTTSSEDLVEWSLSAPVVAPWRRWGTTRGDHGRPPATLGPVNWAEIRASRTLHEDDAILVLDKPTGWSVMGERHDTDLVRLAADEGEKLWAAHRIDKVTSGVVLFAKDLAHHGDLTRQFNARTVEKTYLALTATTGLPERGRIELPLSVGRKNRVRIAAPRESIVRDGDTWSVPADAVLDGVSTYPSTTTFSRLGEADGMTLLAVHPETGRRHQNPGALGLDRARDRRRPALRQAPDDPHRAPRAVADVRRPRLAAAHRHRRARGGLPLPGWLRPVSTNPPYDTEKCSRGRRPPRRAPPPAGPATPRVRPRRSPGSTSASRGR